MARLGMDEVLIDDSTDVVPGIGLKDSLPLHDRFGYRLGQLTGAKVTLCRNHGASGLIVYICLPNTSLTGFVKYTTEFAADLQTMIRRIAGANNDLATTKDIDELWDIVLLYAYQNNDEIIKKVKKIFEDQRVKYHAMIDAMFNLHGVSGSKSSFDTELGADIMLLEQYARMYGGRINQQNNLIDLAWDMVRNHSELAVRMRAALQSVFANNLYDLVCALGSMKRTLHTVVRIAKTDESFNKVNIRLGQPPHSTSRLKPIVPKLTKASNPAQSAQNSPIMTPSASPSSSKVDVWGIIKPYLTKEDQERGLHQLSSVAKQDTAILLAFVVRGLVPPAGTMAYFSFGFVTCLDKKQERNLMQCYQRVLRAVALPTTAFNELVNALEQSTLYGLLRNKTDPEIQHRLPALHKFLTVRPEQLWSVFRLVHFIRDSDNDEPLPCLKRDFGFKLCKQREEVTKLKALYARVIQKAGPKALHSACVFGRLFHFVNATLGFVEPPMRRFLQNDYPSPAVGFDNSQGLELYLAPLFKKSLRG